MMNNFYQSPIWRTINTSIFQKPVFEIDLFGKKYFGTVKSKKKFGFNLQWFQVMGIQAGFPSQDSYVLLKESLYEIARDYSKDYGNIMFQLGFTDLLTDFPVSSLKSDNHILSTRKLREETETLFKNSYNLLPSFRENMPLSTIIFDLTQGYDTLFQSMSKSARAHINKGNYRNLIFTLANTKQERDEFYNVWYDTSTDKGFNIFSKELFDSLRNFLNPKTTGNLFLAKLDGQIVSGSICFFVGETIVYMYGATNRKFGNVGGHHFLKSEMFKRGIENGFKTVDLLGTAPTGYPDHHLSGVSKFKESLGGIKLEYYGNYDYVFNNHLYNLFKYLKS